MAGAKKFGAFGGVFTPSILTILGVIMYMRLGWVVGNAGLYGTIIIICIAHIISVTTGLSISSIATDKKVGPGGVYYVISRSLGLPIGGAIGSTLFVGTALSIALYLIGFAESFTSYIGFEITINVLRIGGTIALIVLAILALISTAFAIKTQYIIMGAIAISLVSIFLGSWEFAPIEVSNFGNESSVPMATVFAIFFPAVTGFTAGIAMSGDLKDPKKSIPAGTIAAIIVGFLIYIVLAVFIANAINSETLVSDYNILSKIALFAPAVVFGIWGATLSSALGGILGGPRILQAMSVDKITPAIFGKGFGADNEPRNALFLTILIAEGGVLIGELDLIARIVSMFYLAAYGFINLSFFLESWASADFNPTFKVKRWIGLVGFLATFTVMFKLDMMAMFAAFLIIGGIYAYLKRKQLALGSGDIWHSVWSSLVLTGLKRMDKTDDAKRNWKPNILLFSGTVETRPHLIEIAKVIGGKVGMISNFHLIENPEATTLFPKHKQSVQDPMLLKNGIFGRQQEVQNLYVGIETIASTYGFSGIEPNTILLGWAKNTANPTMFAQMNQKLIELDYNVLYLDYDWNKKFGKYKKIDVWWHNLQNNIELTLNLLKFMSISEEWQKASIRVLLINNTIKEGFERKIHQLLDNYRIEATVKVINNYLENKSPYDLMKNNSLEADLIIAGIPFIAEGEEKDFVDNTTEMFGILGTTLLVKSSSILGEDESFDLANNDVSLTTEVTFKPKLIEIIEPKDKNLRTYYKIFLQEIESHALELHELEIASFKNLYNSLAQDCFNKIIGQLSIENDHRDLKEIKENILNDYINQIERFKKEDLPYLEERLAKMQSGFLSLTNRIINSAAEKLVVFENKIPFRNKTKKIFTTQYFDSIYQTQNLFGLYCKEILDTLKTSLTESLQIISESKNQNTAHLDQSFEQISIFINNKFEILYNTVINNGRLAIHSLIQSIENPKTFAENQHKKFTSKQLKVITEKITTYKENWQHAQTLLLGQLQNDLRLQIIKVGIGKIGENIEQEISTSMYEKSFSRLNKVIEWISINEQNSNIDAQDIPDIYQSLTYDEVLIQELMNQLDSLGEILSHKIELIEPDILSHFREIEMNNIETINIDANAAYKYIIQEKLQQPLVKQFLSSYQECMEVLSKLQFELNQLAYKSSMIKYENYLFDLPSKFLSLKTLIDELNAQLNSEHKSKRESLNDVLHTSLSTLNTPSIIEYAIRSLPLIQKSEKNNFQKWMSNLGSKTQNIFENYGNIIASKTNHIQQKNDLRNQDSDVHYNLKKFVEDLTTDSTIIDVLPFYYKQLYLGRIAISKSNLKNRTLELNQAMTLLNSENVDEHCIVILGEPMSGKSSFADAIANEFQNNNIIRIQAPMNGSTNIADFLKTLQKQLQSNTSNEHIISEAAKNSIFIIEDLELWWSRNDQEGKLIKYILNIVNEYKSSYRFILSCNNYAFLIMQQQGLLEYLTGSKIFLSNFGQKELKSLLFQRHESSGLRLAINDKIENDFSSKESRKLIDRYYQSSNGIVGIALLQWINNIKEYKEDIISMDYLLKKVLPDLGDKELLILLSQFLIHKHLDADRIQHLFDYKDRRKAEIIISKLAADGVIENIMGSAYRLNPLITVWVIKKASEFSLI